LRFVKSLIQLNTLSCKNPISSHLYEAKYDQILQQLKEGHLLQIFESLLPNGLLMFQFYFEIQNPGLSPEGQP